VAVVLVLLGFGLATTWHRMNAGGAGENPESVTTDGQDAEHAPSETNNDIPEAMDSEPDADGEPPDTEDGSPEADPGQLGRADLSALHQKVLPALVTVYRESSRGTGFLIEGGLVVTAYHVAPLDQRATVVFQDKEEALVIEHVAFDAARDIAVLRTDSKKVRQPLRLAKSLPATGSPVAAFKPGGGELQGIVTGIGKGMVSGESARCEMLLTTLNAVPGWSGGPVVNMEREVVGVNSRLDGSAFESQGLKIATGSAAVPVTVLEPLLAIVRLSEAITSDPTNAIYRRDRAALYLSKGDFEKAIEDYNVLIRLEPKNAEAYCSRGKAYAERSQYEKAVDDYTNAIDLNQDSVEAYRGRAAAREKKADMDGAISDYRALIELLPKAEADALEPRLVQIYKDRAKLRAGARETDKAIADLSAVLDLRPNDFESREERARFYDAKGESDQAIADYTEAIRLEPKKADLYRCRGIVLAVKGDHDKAITDFTDAIRLNPKDAEAFCARGAVQGGRHNFKKAIADFTEAIRLEQWQGKAYFDRGSAYTAQGDETKARKDFGRAKDLGYRPGR
jgi:tetratricopeptide (TPR) repeat protein